ncbi:hypothetical protein RRU94_09215 [Domibacillus sp. DTU_2020_1001157_1_SI_ALB_TIR_016]|uniref:hypothetical protein n=1 Tax=Domibacillus sp. DTU_2020_1001157_1_SI_ALB_TIR_016 TaxID=3077789 RepID=UPI0028E53A2B|nr:hypothetical protein [Domibacillus sp. DTU_2020_1001157_1_SI_ALB_TIR_016]WNS80989.1 hypothetical protein RRU94_09215 [Domibacillus sp. DTU_2020_1001157_1_SI_ALB_TIR_016]
MTVTSLYERELLAVLNGFSDYVEKHADPEQLERLYHTWIPLLSTYVTHDAVESTLDEWYAMIENDFLWLHYIEEKQVLTEKPIIQHILEIWKKPFAFAGSRLPNGRYEHWADGIKWNIRTECAEYIIGIALPLGESEALLVHWFETDEAFQELLEDGFSETKDLTRQQYLNGHYLTCLSFQSDNT